MAVSQWFGHMKRQLRTHLDTWVTMAVATVHVPDVLVLHRFDKPSDLAEWHTTTDSVVGGELVALCSCGIWMHTCARGLNGASTEPHTPSPTTFPFRQASPPLAWNVLSTTVAPVVSLSACAKMFTLLGNDVARVGVVRSSFHRKHLTEDQWGHGSQWLCHVSLSRTPCFLFRRVTRGSHNTMTTTCFGCLRIDNR